MTATKAASGKALIARAMKEIDLQRAVIERGQRLDLLVYHTYDSRMCEAGYPDLTIVGHRGAYFWELKREGEDPTAAQLKWLTRLAGQGFLVAVRRPSDLLSGLIDTELRKISRLGGG